MMFDLGSNLAVFVTSAVFVVYQAPPSAEIPWACCVEYKMNTEPERVLRTKHSTYPLLPDNFIKEQVHHRQNAATSPSKKRARE